MRRLGQPSEPIHHALIQAPLGQRFLLIGHAHGDASQQLEGLIDREHAPGALVHEAGL
jgi:hypothetical protein